MIADDVAYFLALHAIGIVATDLFAGRMPDQPDVCMVIAETGGRDPLMVMGSDTINVERPGFQVHIRDTSYAAGEARAYAVFALLEGITEAPLVSGTPSGATYKLIHASQSPHHIGLDDQQRHLWVQNFSVLWENPDR